VRKGWVRWGWRDTKAGSWRKQTDFEVAVHKIVERPCLSHLVGDTAPCRRSNSWQNLAALMAAIGAVSPKPADTSGYCFLLWCGACAAEKVSGRIDTRGWNCVTFISIFQRVNSHFARCRRLWFVQTIVSKQKAINGIRLATGVGSATLTVSQRLPIRRLRHGMQPSPLFFVWGAT
jgi:hypothetical protein